MRNDVSQAIEQVIRNAHQWASREWEARAQRFAGAIIVPGDSGSEARMTEGRLNVLPEKVNMISAGVKTAFECRREIPTEEDVNELFRRVDSELQADVNFIVSRIGGGPNAGNLMNVRHFAQEKGSDERLSLMHNFREMLIGLQNSRRDQESNRGSINITGSQHVQVGSSNVNIEAQTQSHVAPRETKRSKLFWWALGIPASIAAGLVVAYLTHLIGWKK